MQVADFTDRRAAVRETSFRVMGSGARVVTVGGPEELTDVARRRLAHLEACWSRFLPDSDVSRLNRADGQSVTVDPATVTLLTHLVAAWRATGGAFDPTLLPAVVAAGYEASWDDPTTRTSLSAGLSLRGRPEGIVVDPSTATARLPRGTTVDPGGLGKGLAADLVSVELVGAGASGALVSVGGDVRMAGQAPRPEGWHVDVEDPFVPDRVLTRVVLSDGGAATSSTLARSWSRGGRRRHHLIDPATGMSAATAVIAATVIASTAAWAEAFAKLPLVVGAATALSQLDALGLPGVVVGASGEVASSSAWDRFSA